MMRSAASAWGAHLSRMFKILSLSMSVTVGRRRPLTGSAANRLRRK
jgi:hypothetical protein